MLENSSVRGVTTKEAHTATSTQAANRGLRTLAIVVAASLLSSVVALRATAEPKVLLVVRKPSCTEMQTALVDEAVPMLRLLRRAGCSVDVSNATGETFGAGVLALKCDVKFSEVELDGYVAIVVPCMAADEEPVPNSLIALVRDADSKEMIIAAQHASEVLVCAGMLNRKWAVKPGIVKDGNLLTSCNSPSWARSNTAPVDTEALIEALVAAIKKR
jgi:hypothetical protein